MFTFTPFIHILVMTMCKGGYSVASSNEYKRYFIILQEDDKGYEMSPGKIPTGYVKIEVKNGKVRLNAFIQNVKVEDRIEYRLILVAAGKNQAVDVGKILIDSSGRGELSCELESDNIMKSGLNISDFSVAAVTAGSSIPLSGYSGRDKLEWKGKYHIVNRQQAQEPPRIDKKIEIEEIVPEMPEPPAPPAPPVTVTPQPVIQPPAEPPKKPKEKPPVIEIVPEPVPVPEPKPEPKPEPAPVPEPVPAPEPEPVIIVQPAPVEHTHIIHNTLELEVNMPECPPMAPMEEPCEAEDIHQYYYDDDSDSDSDSDDDRPKHKKKEAKEMHHEMHHEECPYYSSAMYSRLKKLLRRLRDYEPFEEERGYEWFKVGDDIYELNSVAVPYMGYMMPLGYPFMSEGCSMMLDRKDYILGVKYDDKDDDRRRIKYLLFGVPAIYSKRNAQYYRSRGFMEYKPHKSKGYGYFIMCLDLRSGMLCRES